MKFSVGHIFKVVNQHNRSISNTVLPSKDNRGTKSSSRNCIYDQSISTRLFSVPRSYFWRTRFFCLLRHTFLLWSILNRNYGQIRQSSSKYFLYLRVLKSNNFSWFAQVWLWLKCFTNPVLKKGHFKLVCFFWELEFTN